MTALVLVGEAFVVDAEAVHHGGVEVVDLDGVLGDVVAEVVGFSVADAGFDASSGHPEGEAAGVVVASVIDVGEDALGVDGGGGGGGGQE